MVFYVAETLQHTRGGESDEKGADSLSQESYVLHAQLDPLSMHLVHSSCVYFHPVCFVISEGSQSQPQRASSSKNLRLQTAQIPDHWPLRRQILVWIFQLVHPKRPNYCSENGSPKVLRQQMSLKSASTEPVKLGTAETQNSVENE